MDTPLDGGLSPEERALVPVGAGGSGGSLPPPPDDEEGEDDGMLRMSFLEHLEEMRHRIIRALQGFGVAFLVCIVFANQLWDIVRAPAVDALKKIGVNPPVLVINEPMEGFSIIWVKVPLVISLFIAGGAFAYFVAFRFGLAFLLGLGMGGGVIPLVTITNYFDLFVNVMLGV